MGNERCNNKLCEQLNGEDGTQLKKPELTSAAGNRYATELFHFTSLQSRAERCMG